MITTANVDECFPKLASANEIIDVHQYKCLQIALYSKLTAAVLSKRAARLYDKETLALAAKLLEQNPELYTVWNYRREALHNQLKVGASAAPIDNLHCASTMRAAVSSTTETASVSSWWKAFICLQGADGPEAARKVAAQELQLTQAALTRNPKSYSSWHYRKLITEQQLLPLEDELQLVQQ